MAVASTHGKEDLEAVLPHLSVALRNEQRLALLEARSIEPIPGWPAAVMFVDARARVLRVDGALGSPQGQPLAVDADA